MIVSRLRLVPAPSSPHPTPAEWLDKALRRLDEPGGFVYPNDLVLIADLAHALSVTLDALRESQCIECGTKFGEPLAVSSWTCCATQRAAITKAESQ